MHLHRAGQTTAQAETNDPSRVQQPQLWVRGVRTLSRVRSENHCVKMTPNAIPPLARPRPDKGSLLRFLDLALTCPFRTARDDPPYQRSLRAAEWLHGARPFSPVILPSLQAKPIGDPDKLSDGHDWPVVSSLAW
ncbi:hypothetical protein N7539_007665 [Penicillium diatomitis]|uniref:Uncharacterized protein n=1 Tax=Penicillium diatomitis TaxID=2819901 RepID=A0A9W9WVL5_9EURO|nr:uncharacterized protein N7539_007665 [Penicillium diatomitis]KAJ5477521.1 hypothetical protein N7539_007665 [Penicillium diatomitis]